MAAEIDNLRTLHEHEEQLRLESLAIIAKSEALTDHLQLVRAAMNIIYGYTHDHPHTNDDELTLQMLGIRLFNASAASIKLALSGYYQIAFAQLRDFMETYFLIDFFAIDASKISLWQRADKRQLRTQFSPVAIRQALDKRDGFTTKKRDELYARLSTYASHPTYRGFILTTRSNLGDIGPFVAEATLVAWLEEMAKLCSHGATVLAAHFTNEHRDLAAVKRAYHRQLKSWHAKYLRNPQ